MMRRRGGLGIRIKLTLLIEGAMLVLGAVTGVIATVRERATLEAELRKRGLAIAADLAAFSVRPLLANDLATLRRFVNHSMRQDYVRSVSLLDAEGVVVMHSDLAQVGRRRDDELARAAAGSATAGYRASVTEAGNEPLYDIYTPITAAEARLGTVILGYSRAAAEAEIARARRAILWVGLSIAVLAGGFAYLLASYVSIPITRIAAAMQSTSEGAVATVPAAGRRDEIGVLAASFNQMADDLSRHRRHLEELVEARTAALTAANARLECEIAERTKAEAELRQSREELRDLASYLQSVREQERARIAREIHDELGQTLTALKMDVHWIGQRAGDARPDIAGKTAAMSKAIDATVQTVRRLSSDLRPKLLDDLGLSAAIEWQAREFEGHSGIQCDVRSEPEDIVLDGPRSTALFRIFQETITNVARHAGASRIDVVLRRQARAVELTVADDGRGITPQQACDAASLGILGMRERARSLGGRLEVAGRPDRGTTVRVTVPCPEVEGVR